MDIKQQTKNVAAQGRFGDSMLLHVNPAEVKGLASAMPITMNPETGQPEAFLPFLAPMLGSLLGPSILGGLGSLGLSSAALSGIGAGLATYAQTGGSGSKALLSGLTAGLGAKALNTAAQGVPTEITTTPPVDPSLVGPPAPPVTTTLPTITPESSLVDTGSRLFSGGLDEGLKNVAGAAMTPTGMLAGTAAGTGAVMQSQEEFERQMNQMQLDEEERKKRMYEMYPEQIPVATGGSTNFADGGITGYRRGENVYYDPRETNDFNFGSGEYYVPGGRAQTTTRRARPITPGFMAGFSPEYRYFQGDDPKTYLTRYARDIQDSANPQIESTGYSLPPQNYRGFRQPRLQPLSPPGGFMPPPRFGGYGNPFMQTPSYRSFYGNPQMGGMINPYARFTQQPIQPYFAPPSFYTPPPRDDIPPPPNKPIVPPTDDGIGRKGRTRNIEPVIPSDDFVTRGPARGPINEPINTPPPTITIPIEGGADVKIPDFSKINTPITPPMIGGLEDRDAMRDEMSIDRGLMINENPVTFTPPVTPPPVTSPTLPTPAAPANTPMQKPMSIGGPGDGMFGAPMFAGGGDTNKELPNEGLKALAKTEKGRKAVEAMGYQEGQDINIPMPTGQSTDMMMQDPIVQEVIQFILGETDNNEIINEFLIKYGQKQLMMLRDMVLKQAAGNPDVQTEGLIQGVGNSGMADDLPMNIGNKAIAAVSQDEYIIPADVVSMLGDGSSDAGSKQLDGMLDRVRMAKTGGKTQAKPINPNKVLPA